jgi:dTDP-4-dehydrorhamnose reductase
MRILVTGASGLLGLNLALEAAKGHDVVGTVNSQLLHCEDFKVIQTDLLAPSAVEHLLDDIQPDWVIHCAALANVDACEADPALAQKLNTELPGKLASYVARGGARLLHVSTDAVFDGQLGDYREEDLPNPLSTYAKTKLAGEMAVSSANPEALIARVNLFGWSASGKRSLAEFFFNNLSIGNKVQGFTDVYFCPLLANDLAHIMLAMLSQALCGVYHVVSPCCLSKFEFGVKIAEQFGLNRDLIEPSSVEEACLPAQRSPNLTLRTDKLHTDLGNTLPDVHSGIEYLFQLYKQGYPERIRSLAGGSDSQLQVLR